MDFQDVTLVNGDVVRVYRPPTSRLLAEVEKLHPRPQPPVKTETTKSGREIVMRIEDDPDYLKSLVQWEQEIRYRVDEMASLWTFKDERPPDDWSVEDEVGDEMRYFNPDWRAREGKVGKKLDWIEWHINGDPVDALHIQQALNELMNIDMEEVAQVEESFRDSVEGTAA